MKRFPIVACCLLSYISFVNFTYSQSNTPWKFISENTINKETQNRRIIPESYETLELNLAEITKVLSEAPERFTEQNSDKTVFLSLPLPNGQFHNFQVEKWSILHPELEKKYPEIRTYVGYGIEDPSAIARIDITPHGFHAMIRSSTPQSIFIDPYSVANTQNYISYYKSDLKENTEDLFGCFTQSLYKNHEDFGLDGFQMSEQGDCNLRTYRLALACTGEYGNYHGGTKASVLAAMTTTMNRVNGIFENDLGVHLQLIPNNDLLIFLDGATDPYTNNDGSAMLNENQIECDNTIGSGNYDIGHVFSTGGGGVAFIRSVCNNSIKAGGVTGRSNPIGDPFDVDYVCHELGHQFGANHTQNNNCNRNGATAVEPGSGSTIMGYAGICSPNVQGVSGDYFHAISLEEISNYITGAGNVCASTTITGNNPPTANAGSDYTIPHSTPFCLTGAASDPEGLASLTYSWEQIDAEVGSMPPSSGNTVGPMFRSLSPSDDPTRYFPNLSDLSNNSGSTWEVLAGVSRNYNFRFTVRDNHNGAGCTTEDDMAVAVDGNTGPFRITSPNSSVNWSALSTQIITWDVSGTDSPPVNASKVDIFLSTDGGLTYPNLLASGVNNDGSHAVIIPNVVTSNARIMIKGTDHIFFDISDENFSISNPQTDFIISASPDILAICSPSNAVFQIDIGTTGGFSENVDLSISNLPVGGISNFSINPVSSPGSSILTIGNTENILPGIYPFTIKGNSSTGTKEVNVQLIIDSTIPDKIELISPLDQAISVDNTPTFKWEKSSLASSYRFILATDTSFNNVVEEGVGLTDTTFIVTNDLNPNTLYYWRVQGENECGISDFSTRRSFTTSNIICKTFTSTDVPKEISSSGTPIITSQLQIDESGIIEDINITNLEVSHTWVNDLVISISSPNGNSTTLLNQLCNSEDNVELNFDDESTNLYSTIPCPPIGGGIYQPNQPLSTFLNEEINGTWQLTVQDLFNQDGGKLNNWELEICYQTTSIQPLSLEISGTNNLCFDANDGSAQVSVSGGVEPYQYDWSTGDTTSSITNLVAGTYSVTVIDDTGTSKENSIQITQPNDIIIVPSATDANCGDDNGTASIDIFGGQPPYHILWENGDTTSSVSNLFAGNYGVTIFDNFQCSSSKSIVVNGTDALSTMINKTDLSCHGSQNGTASITASGGTGNYSFHWSTGNSTQFIDGLEAGSYQVTVSDLGVGCATVDSIFINEPSELSITTNFSNATCGQNNGSASVEVTGGTPPYFIQWSNGSTNSDILNLEPKIYSVTVIDANDCADLSIVSITGTDEISGLIVTTPIECAGANDGTATAFGSGGSGNYSYTWSNGENTQEITGLSEGVYHVTITDDNTGCATTSSVILIEPEPIEVVTSFTTAFCGENNGSINATAFGGSIPYTYIWSTGDTSAFLSDLPSDDYSVTVYDSKGCFSTASLFLEGSDAILATVEGNDLLCFEEKNGSATAYGNGGSGTYGFIWSNGATTQTIQNLDAGVYHVTVYDLRTDCSDVTSITISEPPPISATTITSNAACEENNGTATVSISGGEAPYSINWSTGSTQQSISNLEAGIYFVTIYDKNQCEVIQSATVNNTSGIELEILSTNLSCFGDNNATAEVLVNGGSGNYSYHWSNSQTTSSIQNLTLGSYSVTVTDLESGCAAMESLFISQPDELSISLQSSNSTCGENNGSAFVEISGGTSPYSIEWSNGSQENTIENLAAGTYTVLVEDSNNCQKIQSISVDSDDGMSISFSGEDVSCNGANDGSISVSVTGGSGNFLYEWSNGGTTPQINNLPPGTYEVLVTDVNFLCLASGFFTVSEPTQILLSTYSSEASCDENNGTASVQVSGGGQSYSYLWSTGEATESISNLSEGIYSVTVTDQDNCFEVTEVQVQELSGIGTSISGTDVSCFGGNDANATVQVSGGSGNYSYTWSTGEMTDFISDLNAGLYNVTVSDEESGCIDSAMITINEPSPILLEIAGTDATIDENGSADLTITGGTPDYSILWSNGAQTEDIQNLPPDTYVVTVFDANDCMASDTIIIQESDDDCPQNLISFTLALDDYPGETTWELKNGDGVIIDNGGPYDLPGEIIFKEYCLPDGCYSFSIYDTWGDGICCAYGSGFYEIMDDDAGNPLVMGSQFEYNKTANFCLPNQPAPCSNIIIDEQDFEDGWGIWNDGGSDSRRSSNDKNYAESGDFCIRLRDNTSTSVMTTDNLDLSSYEEITVAFSYYVRSFENVEDFWFQTSNNGGGSYTTIEEWNRGDEFQNNVRSYDSITIQGPFTSNMRLRFRADASGNSDWVYFDDIVISGCVNAINQNGILSTTNPENQNPFKIEKNDSQTINDFSILELFPNPATSKLTIEYQTSSNDSPRFYITDFSGRIIKDFEGSEGQSIEVIDLQEIKTGYYFLHMISKMENLSRKFVVIK